MTRVAALRSRDGDAPYDDDVFCQRQDYDNQTFSLVSDRVMSESRYEAIVRGSDKDMKPWTFVLTPIGGKWKITDVIDESGRVRTELLTALQGKQGRGHRSITSCGSLRPQQLWPLSNARNNR